MAQENPFKACEAKLSVDDKEYSFFDITKLNDERLKSLPVSIKVLLECAIRNCDEYTIKKDDVERILGWYNNAPKGVECPFKPARVVFQDFTGVPSVVDLAAMRTALARLGGDPTKVNPAVPADLVIDHSVQVDYYGNDDAVQKNQAKEMERNKERFQFLKWGSKAFDQFCIVPPGAGIVHQVNLEYLARVVFDNNGTLYPDSLVGTDSHTTMINGLGVTGWGVGGIEAESVLTGQSITMVLPEVVGYRLTGALRTEITATDLVLTIVQNLRKHGVVGKFVEFFGPGLNNLSLADRATIANMAPEYGATMGFFPIDNRTLEYLELTNRDPHMVKRTESYLRAQGMFVDHANPVAEPKFSSQLELDISTVDACVSGPKRPHDRELVSTLKDEFNKMLTARVGFKGFGLPEAELNTKVDFDYQGETHTLTHGDLVIAAITSCTNTSNPNVLIGAGLLAKRAVEMGLKVKPYIKTSLAPGSGVVREYLAKSGLQPYLNELGFNVVAFGCTTCIGNSGELETEAEEAINKGNLVASAVLSGNRNFEGRVHNNVRAAWLASPPLVVAYALAGTVSIDFETEPLGKDKDGNDVFLRDLWPTSIEIGECVAKYVVKESFKSVYEHVTEGAADWQALQATEDKLYNWDDSSYIHHPPFFQSMGAEPDGGQDITNAYALLNLGDSITTDHISPAGKIARNSPAARYLQERGVSPKDFNTYGSRRGNDEVMARGTFANVRLVNKFCEKPGANTMHVPSGKTMAVFDAAMEYKKEGHDLIILGGSQYGSGSSRDWAAKGPHLQGVKAVIAKSYERIHRSNLVGMGIVPLQYKDGQDADSIGLTGKEQFSMSFSNLSVRGELEVKVSGNDKVTSFKADLRLDTPIEIEYIKHGGILHYVIRQLL